MRVDPAWLEDRLGRVKIVDGSWHMPDTGRDADAEFLTAHIKSAQRFAIDRVADTTSGLAHTMPAPAEFARHVGAMGIGTGDTVVVYEAGAPFAAPRVVWMFHTMGCKALLLNGGLARWQAEGRPVETGPADPVDAADFAPSYDASGWTDADGVAAALAGGSLTVVDARSPERFAGSVAEPRPGLRAGHMPGARNVHYQNLVTADGQLKEAGDMRAVFEEAGVDLSKPVITSCGSGVTAAILSLALQEIGTPSAVYDGSWSEWGGDLSRPVATGDAD